MTKRDTAPAFVKRDLIINGKDYALLLGKLKEIFRSSVIKAAVKVNSSILEFYWMMGRDISHLRQEAKWGSAFFDCLSLDLRAEFPNQTGFSVTNIKYAKRWYEFYNQDVTIRQQAADEFGMPLNFGLVPWFHHVTIISKCNTVDEAFFYIDKTIENGWSRAELEAQIESDLYQRQGLAITNFDEKLPAPYSGLAKEILKSPYYFGFVDKTISTEQQLEDALANNITRFLLELGQGFAYVGRQMELKMPGGQTFVPDMIFYHTKLKAYIVCELKVVPFTPEFAGKINFYVSAVDELMRQEDDNPTIGLLICKSKDNTVVEWSFRGMSQPVGVAEYKLSERLNELLPSEQDLQKVIDTYQPADSND